MRKILVVVDMQNDFIDGALGTREAAAVVPKVAAKIAGFGGEVIFTQDSHGADYLRTQEGAILPVQHCIRGSEGWKIRAELDAMRKSPAIEKGTFGSRRLAETLAAMNEKEPLESVTFVGVCTDVCVISNAILAKAFLPETPIIVEGSLCAGTSPEAHKTALAAMRACQIDARE